MVLLEFQHAWECISINLCFRLDNCTYSFDTVYLLNDVNITEEIELFWPCELRIFWNSIVPLVDTVRWLLHYGTAIVVAMGLVLNMLSFRILITPHMRKQSTNMYLASLAIYDSCVLVFNFMIGVLRGQNQEPINLSFQRNEWLCLTHSVIVELFSLASVWMIVCFTAERVIAVFLPLKAVTICTIKRTRITILTVSFVIVVISLHKIFVSGFEGDSVFGYKACKTGRKKFPEAIFFYVAFNTALPVVLIVAGNLMIMCKLFEQTRVRQTLSQSNSSSSQAVSDRRVTRMLLIVSTSYVILVLPLGLTQTVELWWNSTQKQLPSTTDPLQQQAFIDYSSQRHLIKWIRAFFFFFYQLNFAINFFLYLLSTARFRRELSKLFNCAVASNYMSGTASNMGAPTDKNSKDSNAMGNANKRSQNSLIKSANVNRGFERWTGIVWPANLLCYKTGMCCEETVKMLFIYPM